MKIGPHLLVRRSVYAACPELLQREQLRIHRHCRARMRPTRGVGSAFNPHQVNTRAARSRAHKRRCLRGGSFL